MNSTEQPDRRVGAARRAVRAACRVRAGVSLLAFLFAVSATGGPQIAWMVRTNLGNSSRQIQVHSMAFDPAGHLVIAGTAASAAGDNDYCLLKYTQTGMQTWAVTYNSGPEANDVLYTMTVSSNGSIYVGGTGKTVKYNSSGALQWVAPYNASALAVDINEFLHIVGFQPADFGVVKLAPEGTNVWLRIWDYAGLADTATAIGLGPEGEVYVGGIVHWVCYPLGCYHQFGLVKYDSDGNRQWEQAWPPNSIAYGNSQVKSVVVPDANRVLAVGNFDIHGGKYAAALFDSSGTNLWRYADPVNSGGTTSVTLSPSGEVFMTGSLEVFSPPTIYQRTVALRTNGILKWQADLRVPRQYHSGNAIALDPAGNVYVAGQQPATDPDQNPDFLLLKYDSEGHQQWTQRYNGPANGSDVATAIAVAPDGAIYVAGHSANINGGTDIVLIKYVELQTIQVQTNQSVLLQFLGTPGQSYRFLATTNFSDWDELGAAIADPLGLYQWLDTNQPPAPHKFYRTVSP